MNRRKHQILNLLHDQRIHYQLVEYSEPLYTIEAVAAQQGIVRERLVKALLLREKKGQRYVMACVIGDARLNPQAVREQFLPDWRRLTFASTEEIQAITGYVRGAVSPLCLPETLPVVFDVAIVQKSQVNIGSGDPAVGVELATQDLLRLTRPRLAPIAEPPVERPCATQCVLWRFHTDACAHQDGAAGTQQRQTLELQSL